MINLTIQNVVKFNELEDKRRSKVCMGRLSSEQHRLKVKMMFEKMDKQSRAIEKEKELKENKNNKNSFRSPKPVTP